jgi:hypothetical protein
MSWRKQQLTVEVVDSKKLVVLLPLLRHHSIRVGAATKATGCWGGNTHPWRVSNT